MPTGTAPVNLTFCTRGAAATIRMVVSGVPAHPRRGRAGNFTPKPLGLNGSYSRGLGPISCAIKGNLDRLTEAATGGRDDRGDADVSGDTDRDPEADALAPTVAHRENRADSWASARSLSLEAS
jgi:hypothetical protein